MLQNVRQDGHVEWFRCGQAFQVENVFLNQRGMHRAFTAMRQSLRIPIDACKHSSGKRTFQLPEETAVAASDIDDPQRFFRLVVLDQGRDQPLLHH